MGTSETRRKGRSGADLSQLILVSERAKSAAEASASTAIGHLLPPPPQQLPSRGLFLGACLLRVGGQAKERLVPYSSLPCFVGNGHLLQNGVTRVGWRSFQNRGGETRRPAADLAPRRKHRPDDFSWVIAWRFVRVFRANEIEVLPCLCQAIQHKRKSL